MSHMSTSQSPTSAASILAQLTNDESTAVVMCTPVYSFADGAFKKALGDGSAKAVVIGLVVDERIAAAALGSVLASGAIRASTAQWDAVCGTSGGLAFGTKYYLSTSVAGTLTTSNASGVAVIEGLSSTTGLILAGGSGSSGGFSAAIGSFNGGTFTVTAAASGNSIVEVTNPGADTAIQLIDLGSAPTTGQLLFISVLPTSTGGFDCVTGGTPSGTKKAFAASSSIAPPGSAICFFYNGTQWSPLFATPGQTLKVQNSILTAGSIIASGNITAAQLLLGGALRVQACIIATNVAASATVDLNATSEGVVQRLFLNGQTSGAGSISNVINSAAAPTGGQSLEIINSSAFPFTLNGAAGGTGQLILPSGSTFVVQPGQTVFCDYDSANELGHGSNVWIVLGWTSGTAVFYDSGGFWGKPGVILINEATGDISTVGGLTASGTISGAGNITLTDATPIIYSSLSGSAGNQDLDLMAAGTGAVRVNFNAGGLANAGTGGLIVYGGANGSTSKVALNADGTITLNNGPKIRTGSGSPNTVVTGSPGDMYLNTAGGANTTLYVKESGSATNTGWVAK